MFAPIRRQQRIYITLMFVADLFTVPSALLITWFVRTYWLANTLPEFTHSLTDYLITLPALLFLWGMSWWSSGMYAKSSQDTPFTVVTHRMRAVFYLALSIMAASYLVKIDYSRIMLLLFLIISQPINVFFRNVSGLITNRFAPIKASPNTLIVGSGEFASRVIRSLQKLPEPKHKIKGILVEQRIELIEVSGVNVIGDVRDLPRLVESLSIDEVFFASDSISRTEMLKIVNLVQKDDIVFLLVTDLFEIATGAGDLSSLSKLPVVEIGSSKRGVFNKLSKRLMDIILSPILVIALMPLMFVVWLILFFRGKGSPIFKQTRIGRSGKPFTLLKFRTMKPETDEYEVAPVAGDDSRITGIGRLLRKTSLDELPQLFNVIKGDMSMVGPRPEMDFIVQDYNAWQRRRLDVKPGITGLWQIMGRKDLPLTENLEYDFYYIRNHSVMLDLAILARTVVTVLKGRGAY